MAERCMKPVYAVRPASGQTAYLDWPTATFTPCQLDEGHGGECKTERGEPAAPAAQGTACKHCGQPIEKCPTVYCAYKEKLARAEQELANWRKVSGYDS